MLEKEFGSAKLESISDADCLLGTSSCQISIAMNMIIAIQTALP